MLKGRCAIVTGSSGGLGNAIAMALAKQGASVVIHGLCDPAIGQTAADKLARATGAGVMFDDADLVDVLAIEGMFGRARARFGNIDIMVNNAVTRHFSSIDKLTPEQWNTSLAVNVSAAFHCVRLSLPTMRQKGWGRIINVSSIYGARGAENRIDYVTTKTALLGMTRAIAIETAETGITCNAICPGVVPTPAILNRIAESAKQEGKTQAQGERDYLSTRNPTRRFVSLEGVGELVAFLCSQAAQDITGATVPIDGGWQAS